MKQRGAFLLLGIVCLLAVGALQMVRARPSLSVSQDGTAAIGATKKNADCTITPKPREFNAAPYYEGPLIDAHLHMPVSSAIVAAVGRRMGFEHMPSFGGKLTPDYLVCLFKSEGITQVIGFFHSTKFNMSAEVRAAENFQKKYPGLVSPFFMPATNDTLRVSTSTVKAMFDKNKGLFKGIGEVKMFDHGSVLRPVFRSHYDLANERGLSVMLHPYHEHRTEIMELLRRYPRVKFLFHGDGDREWNREIIGQYPNAYYSLDANLTSLYGSGPQHRDKAPSKEEFVAYFRGHFDEVLQRALSEWKPRIEAYPNRFMWGTDRWYDWHFDEAVGALLEEFGRAFIGRLAPEAQERFAHKNAEAFLAGR